MGQVTIYLEDDVEKKMIANAKAMNLSKSKWIANVIREKLARRDPGQAECQGVSAHQGIAG